MGMINPFLPFSSNKRRGRRRQEDFSLDADVPAASPTRRRRAWWYRPLILLVGFATVWVGGTFFVAQARERWLYHLDELALKRIPVARDGVLTDEEIRRIAGVSLGRNILTVDLFQVRQRLLRHPRLAEARVRLDFPDQLTLEIRERIPIARALLPPVAGVEAFYLLDEEGHVILPFQPGRAPVDIIESEASLPLLTGVHVESFNAGAAVDDERVRAALRLLTWFDSSELAGQTDMVSLDVGQAGSLVALTSQGAQITFGLDDFERQLRDWRSVQERANTLNKAIASLDLSVRQNAPLRWQGSNAPPVKTSIPKTSKPKRKPVHKNV
jgi:cell division septal protein FtsQ